MKIELAKHSGFCLGVRNSILRMVNEINTSNDDIYVYGPLIHNPQTIDVLNKRGLKTIDNLDNIDNKQIAIRTHGIPLNENKEIKSRASRLINLTCPRVAKVQSIIKKYSKEGYFTLIIGDENHAEVIGLKSYALNGIKIITSIDDIDKIPKKEKYLLVSQTTLDRELFNKIVERLKQSQKKNLLIIDTICNSTRNRQLDVKNSIHQGVDTLVVVGGRNSANTKRLAQIGEEYNINTLYVETENEIDQARFTNSKYIMVTAGASTPGWIINNVLEKLYDIKFKKANIIIKIIKIILEFTVRTNILSSIAAFFFSMIVQILSGLKFDLKLSIIAFMYIFSMYSINNYFDRDFLKTCNSYKYGIYERFGIPLLLLSIVTMVISIVISYDFGILIFSLVTFSNLFGFVYSIDLIKNVVNKMNISIFRKVYNSKVITSIGWLVIIIFLPWIKYDIGILNVLILSIFVLTFIFLRHFLIDLIAFQSDLIFGRDTIPIIIGIRNLNLLSTLISIVTVTALAIFSYLNNIIYSIFIVNIIYYMFLLKKIKKANYLISLKYEFFVDFNFIILMIFFYIIHSYIKIPFFT